MICVEMPTQSRNIVLDPAVKKQMKVIQKRTGLPRKDVVARVLVWLCAQDIEVQKVVMGEIPESLVEQARELALRRMTGVSDETEDPKREVAILNLPPKK
jgi:hypothetical protein